MKKEKNQNFQLSKLYIDHIVTLKQIWSQSSAGENEVILQNNKLREENKKLKQRVAELEKIVEKMKKEGN